MQEVDGAGSRSRSSCSSPGRRCSSRPLEHRRGRRAAARRGGRTLRLAASSTSTTSTLRSRIGVVVGARVRDLREAVQPPGRAGRRGDARRSRRWSTGSRSRRTEDVHLRPEADVPLPHRRAGDGAQLRRRVQPGRESRGSVTGGRLHARDRRRRRGDRREGETISGVRVLGRYRLQIRLTKPLGDFTARLTMPFFCPILPSTPIDPAGDQRPARVGAVLRRRADREPRIVLKRNPYYRGGRPANVDQSSGRSARRRRGLPDSRRAGPDRLLRRLVPPRRVSAPRRAVRDQPAGRAVLRRTSALRPGTSPSTTTGRRSRAGPDPAQEGDQLRDRPAGARARVRVPRAARRTDQMLPPALGRDGEHLPARGRRPRTGGGGSARARQAEQARPLHDNAAGVASAQVFAFNLKQIGIDVEVKYFDFEVPNEKAATGASRTTSSLPAGRPTTPTRPRSSSRSSPEAKRRQLLVLRRPASTADRGGEPPDRRARRRAWADLDVDLMRNNPPWAPFSTGRASFVSASFGCFLSHPVYGVDLAAACKK